MASSKQLQDALKKAQQALAKAKAAAASATTPAAKKKAQAALAKAKANHQAAGKAVKAGAASAGGAGGAGGGAAAAGGAAAPAESLFQKSLPFLGVGTTVAVGTNTWKNKELAEAKAQWDASNPKPTNTALNPDKVTVNPSTVKQQGTTETPQQQAMSQSGSGNVADGRDPRTAPQNETGVGINATGEAERKANLAADPSSSGRAWGLYQGGRYADATGRAVTNNPIAAEQQAYLNQNNMATARQRDMDIAAQLQDRNSPFFKTMDKHTGGMLTKQMEWQERQNRPEEFKKLDDGITPEQRKILAKFNATGEGPEPKVPMYREEPAKAEPQTIGDGTFNVTTAGRGVAEQAKAQANSPAVTDEEIAAAADLFGWSDLLAEPEEEPTTEIAPISEEEATGGQSTADMVIGAAQDTTGYADEASRVSSNLKNYGVGKTLTGRGDLAGMKTAGTFGKVMNKAGATFNVLGALTDTWDEVTGTDGSLIAGALTKGESFGTETGNKGRRANAWGGDGIGSRIAGGGEAFFNGLTGGGYDAMRANIWGGDEYVKQRGGNIEKDPLNAGKFAEWASGKAFQAWDDFWNPRPKPKAAQIAGAVKTNARGRPV